MAVICHDIKYDLLGKGMLTYPQSEKNTRIKRFQVIPFEQAVAKIRVAAEATKTPVGELKVLQVHFGDLKTPVFGGRSGLRIFENLRLPPF